MSHNGEFKPAWWLPGAHMQTIWGTLLRSKGHLSTATERFELDDGDFLDVEWVGQSRTDQPIVIVLHGLGGSVESHYGYALLHAIHKKGWRGAFLHFRGCSRTPNRLAKWYSSGDTEDLDSIVSCLQQREEMPIAIVGISMGGNVLLKWLGEKADKAQIETAIAVSVPFKLDRVADRVQSGFSRVYQWYFLKSIHQAVRNKFHGRACPIDLDKLHKWKTFWSFDDRFTAPLHGYESATDYYAQCSCFAHLKHIKIPTLIVQAQDDPFLTPDAFPKPEDLSDDIQLELSRKGGHVGFISGHIPGKAVYWYEDRIMRHLEAYFDEKCIL